MKRRRRANKGALATIAGSALYAASCGGGLEISPVGNVVTVDASVRDAGDVADGADGASEGAVDAAVDAPDDQRGPEAGASFALFILSPAYVPGLRLAALNLATREEHDVPIPGQYATPFAHGDAPYLLEPDTVARLDAREPWKIVSSWDVHLDDQTDGGPAASAPIAVVSVGTKAYVPRVARNKIAILDVSKTVDGGVPIGTIDLSAFVQPSDTDGTVEPTAAFYVEARHLLYVLLASVDRTQYDSSFDALCVDATPLLVAIDTQLDRVVPIPGASGPEGSFRLAGYNPTTGAQFYSRAQARGSSVYDGASDRLLVLHQGCHDRLADGGVGAARRRGIEQLAFGANGRITATTLLDLSAKERAPSDWAYFGPHQALLSNGPVLRWDPTQSTTGALFAGTGGQLGFIANPGDGTAVLLEYHLPDGLGSLSVSRAQLADGGIDWLYGSDLGGIPGGGISVWTSPP